MRIANTSTTQQPISLAPPRKGDAAKTDTGTSSSSAQDTVSLSSGSSTSTSATYPDPRLNTANKTTQTPDLQTMLDDSNRKAQQIIDLIRPLVEQQGLKMADVASGSQTLSADPQTIAAAKEAIGPDGDMGVTKTAERILSFAKASIGDDPAKLDAVRAAVEKGFSEASKALGGKLPDISQQTYQAIEDTFDSWKANGIPSGTAVLATAPASGSGGTSASTTTPAASA